MKHREFSPRWRVGLKSRAKTSGQVSRGRMEKAASDGTSVRPSVYSSGRVIKMTMTS